MSDRWYYADGERPLGPYGLQELRKALQDIPNWKEKLVWRERQGQWQKAGDISELDHFGVTPPPIPQSPLPQSPVPTAQRSQERSGSVGVPSLNGFSRKSVALLISLYFFAALTFAASLEYRKPFATLARLLDTFAIASIVGTAIALFIVAGLVPIVVWAFRRFSMQRAGGPLYAWFILMVVFGLAMAVGQNFDTENRIELLSKTPLTGKHRQEFTAAARQSCVVTQQKDPLNRQAGITETQMSAYCDCFANALATNLTPDEIIHYAKTGQSSSVTQQKIQDLTPACIQKAIGKQSSIPETPPARVQPTGTAAAPASSNFAQIKLPRGIELHLPRGWWLIGPEFNRLIETSAEAAVDLSGVGFPEGQRTNLIAANSMPTSTYASVRVSLVTPPSALPSEISNLTSSDLNEVRQEMRANLVKILPQQGNQLIDFYGVRLDRVSGHPSLITEYRRSGPKGPVIVQSNQVFAGQQEIQIILSYREAEMTLWKPVIAKIRQSIVVK